jgi:hypothetical protein
LETPHIPTLILSIPTHRPFKVKRGLRPLLNTPKDGEGRNPTGESKRGTTLIGWAGWEKQPRGLKLANIAKTALPAERLAAADILAQADQQGVVFVE